MTQETELLPCPFCGSAPIPHKYLPDRVACQNTGCWICKTYIAIDDWNTRFHVGKREAKPVDAWQAATAEAEAKYLPLAEAWLRYKQDMRPETRNDYLRASSRVFDCAIPGPLLGKKET